MRRTSSLSASMKSSVCTHCQRLILVVPSLPLQIVDLELDQVPCTLISLPSRQYHTVGALKQEAADSMGIRRSNRRHSHD